MFAIRSCSSSCRDRRMADGGFLPDHFFIAGGAPMPLPVIRKYQEDKGIYFSQGYGMTETFRLTSWISRIRSEAGSVGQGGAPRPAEIVDDRDRRTWPRANRA